MLKRLLLILCLSLIALPRASFAAPENRSLQPKAYCTDKEKQDYIPARKRLSELGVFLTLYHCHVPKPSYLLGTLHSDNHDILDRSRAAFDKLTTSEAAYFEIVSEKKSNLEIIKHVLLPQDHREGLPELLGSELYTQAHDIILSYHTGFPDAVLRRYRPWAATVLMEYPAPKGDGAVLDELLQVHARKMNIPLGSLETVDDQFDTFENLNLAEQVSMVRDTVKHIDEVRSLNKELEKTYIRGDMAALERIKAKSFFEIEDPALRQKLVENIIEHRNQRMSEKMLPELYKGNRFIGVGVLHLIDENGLIERLEKQGFFVF